MNRKIEHISMRIGVMVLLSLVVTTTLSVAAFWLTARPIAGQTTFNLRVMKTGIGSGTITAEAGGINCGVTCNAMYESGVSVRLRANPDLDGVSTFAGWSGGGCSGTDVCSVTMSADLAVRAEFTFTTAISPLLSPGVDRTAAFTPTAITTYLNANTAVTTTARFIAALPRDFKQNWILMSRSESLQTGTAQSPRILLPSADAKYVFTVGMTKHGSYPGSHPNAIEYMQWDDAQKNFRFHEIVLDTIPQMGAIITRTRGVSIDDAKCSKCHSTRNVLNSSTFSGTTGFPIGLVQVKNKPNWDAYDSWGGMLPFNRDRIYQGSVEAAAFRHIFNLWNWRNSAENDAVRQIIEQLELQPPHVTPSGPHGIVRNPYSVTNELHIQFGFDTRPAIATTPTLVAYSFDRISEPPFTVAQGGRYVTLRHSFNDPRSLNDEYGAPGADEGRGVEFFDQLTGLNAQRIADELINHRFATGSVPIDVRPIALAILTGTLEGPPARCLNINAATNTVVSTVPGTPLMIALNFFNARHGITGINQLVTNTRSRAQNLPQRKADIQKLNLDRRGDPYLLLSPLPPIMPARASGLFQQYMEVDPSLNMLRQEVFRRPFEPLLGSLDVTVIGGIYVDREDYEVNTVFNTEMIALYRYFLEPLGVSVDKWSMGVRGRSRTYTFADVFDSYIPVLRSALEASLASDPRELSLPNFNCDTLISAVNTTLSSARLPAANAVPTYTDIQRIFNKSCIECHGGLGYPPFANSRSGFDLSEDETRPPLMNSRLRRSHGWASSYAADILARIRTAETTCNPTPTGPLSQFMPCGGPPLNQTDIETIRRWIDGGSMYSEGDPHLRTVDGVSYDFQSAGEFVLLRGEDLEIQVRQRAVETAIPLPPHPHSGLSTCASVNAAVALQVGAHRVTYQPNLSGQPDPSGLQLRVDGKLADLNAGEILLSSGERIVRTPAPGGIQIEFPGGSVVVITPHFWPYGQVWHLDINGRHIRATEGLMGSIVPGNWLPALPDGTLLGPRPNEIHPRYVALYETFADAWRVSDTTTLFDYAPGTSTATFTIDRWPTDAGAQEFPSCAVPEQPSGKPPLEPLSLEKATQYCSAIVAEDRRANCVQDVMVTGESGFANAYLLTQQVESNAMPTAPSLALPENNKTIVVEKNEPITVSFGWNQASDQDNDPVTYRHCLWKIDEMFTFAKCTVVASQTPAWDVVLEPGQTYFWKIIAEDGKGGSTESETRRIVTSAVEPVQPKIFLPFVTQ